MLSILVSLMLAATPVIRAGAAAVPITPDVAGTTVCLAGYGTNRVATEVQDDVWARALAIEVDERVLVVCAVDLIGFFLSDVEAIRTELADAGDVHLIVAATHTHSGPDTIGLWGRNLAVSGRAPRYAAWVRERIVEAVRGALASMRPARLTVAERTVPGLIRDSRPPFVIDERLSVLAVDDARGEGTIATLTCFPVHPEVLGRSSPRLSSDFPHHLRAALERDRGGVALHVSGSIGGLMAPRGDALIDPATGVRPAPGSLRMMELYGERLAVEARLAIDDGEVLDAGPLVVSTRKVTIPLANGYFRAAVGLGVIGGRPLLTAGEIDERRLDPLVPGFPAYPLGAELATEVSRITLGPWTLAAVPGEIYPEITLGRIPRDPDPGRDFPDAPVEPALQDLLPGRFRWVVGLANDEIGYILPKCQWDEDPPWTFGQERRPYGEINSIGPEAGPRILAAFAEILAADARDGAVDEGSRR